MEDQDTTVQPADQTALTETPVEATTTDTPVETPQTDSSEPSEASTGESQAAPDQDDKLKRFAESQGIELDSPGAIKAAQLAMKSRSEATKNYKRSSELEKATNIAPDQVPADATPAQQENIRIRNLELQLGIQSWKASNPEKLALEGEMVKVLSDPNKKLLVQEGFLTYDDVYNLAKANAPDGTADVKSQAKQEALKSLAGKQQASVPTGHATTRATPSEKPMAEMSYEERRAKLGIHKR